MATLTSVVKFFPRAKEGFITTTDAVTASGAAIVSLNSVSGYADGDVVALVIDPADAIKKQVFTGTIDATNVQVTGVVWTEGTNVEHASGATVVDYYTATHIGMMSKGILEEHNDDGTHAVVTATSITTTGTGTIGGNLSVTGTTALTGALTATGGIVTRVTSAASSATPTPNASTTDEFILTAQAAAAAFAAPTGSPVQGQPLLIRIKDNGTARALTWNAIYRAIGVTLPTTTVINKTYYVGCVYNSTDTKWDVIAVAKEA